VFAGLPGRLFGRQRSASHGSGVAAAAAEAACIDEWHKCVKQLTVSSRESQAHHLIEGQEGCWQSAGNQGKVCLISLLISQFIAYFLLPSVL